MSIINGYAVFCKKNGIEEYHHIISKCKNGSDTLENRAGLCKTCHELVQNQAWADEKLKSLKAGMNKKYGSLSVLNQIIPYLTGKLSTDFPENIYVTSGYSTKVFREEHQIPKDHDLDAYCIACSILDRQNVYDAETADPYEIRQYRRHNRALIHSQRERTYKLDGVEIAKNRRKRMDQKTDSLHDWYIKVKHTCGAMEAHELQKRVTVTKSTRRYNSPDRLQPGTEFLYYGKRFIMSGQISNGQYFRAVGDVKTNYPSRECKVVKNNQGLVFVG